MAAPLPSFPPNIGDSSKAPQRANAKSRLGLNTEVFSCRLCLRAQAFFWHAHSTIGAQSWSRPTAIHHLVDKCARCAASRPMAGQLSRLLTNERAVWCYSRANLANRRPVMNDCTLIDGGCEESCIMPGTPLPVPWV